MVWVPAQADGVVEAAGLTQAQVDAAAWAITPDGRRIRGAGAIAAGLDQLLPEGLPLFSGLYALPGVGRLMDLAYGWVARHRHQLPSGPAYCSLRRPEPIPEEMRQALMRRTEKESRKR